MPVFTRKVCQQQQLVVVGHLGTCRAHDLSAAGDQGYPCGVRAVHERPGHSPRRSLRGTVVPCEVSESCMIAVYHVAFSHFWAERNASVVDLDVLIGDVDQS